jgi:hypothetical protein
MLVYLSSLRLWQLYNIRVYRSVFCLPIVYVFVHVRTVTVFCSEGEFTFFCLLSGSCTCKFTTAVCRPAIVSFLSSVYRSRMSVCIFVPCLTNVCRLTGCILSASLMGLFAYMRIIWDFTEINISRVGGGRLLISASWWEVAWKYLSKI